MMKERDQGLDFLRAVGLLLIILAHVNPPQLLFQLRTFDVTMMVAVSTISYTEYAKPKGYMPYLFGRFKRLILPTWQFIVLQSLLFYILSLLTGVASPFTFKATLVGLLTFSGIGYLWVIRVFLYNALINPLIKKIAAIKMVQGGGNPLVDNNLCSLCAFGKLPLSTFFSNDLLYDSRDYPVEFSGIRHDSSRSLHALQGKHASLADNIVHPACFPGDYLLAAGGICAQHVQISTAASVRPVGLVCGRLLLCPATAH